jgi:hypothetical protein
MGDDGRQLGAPLGNSLGHDIASLQREFEQLAVHGTQEMPGMTGMSVTRAIP